MICLLLSFIEIQLLKSCNTYLPVLREGLGQILSQCYLSLFLL